MDTQTSNKLFQIELARAKSCADFISRRMDGDNISDLMQTFDSTIGESVFTPLADRVLEESREQQTARQDELCGILTNNFYPRRSYTKDDIIKAIVAQTGCALSTAGHRFTEAEAFGLIRKYGKKWMLSSDI